MPPLSVSSGMSVRRKPTQERDRGRLFDRAPDSVDDASNGYQECPYFWICQLTDIDLKLL
jgi:hypothetical protein